METATKRGASEKQQEFIRKLTAECAELLNRGGNSIVAGKYTESLERLEARFIGSTEASDLIDRLIAARNTLKAKYGTAAAAPVVTALRNGTYTVCLTGDEDYVTLQVGEAKWMKDKPGVRQISFLCGPDNETAFKGAAFIFPDGKVAVWKTFKENPRLTAAIAFLAGGSDAVRGTAHEKFLDLANAHALKSGQCIRCGKKLSVPASIGRSMGPVCWEIEAW